MSENYNEPLKNAVIRFEELTADEKARREALQREREILAEKSRMHTATKEGLQKGLQKGFQKGYEQGKKEVAKETEREIALNLLSMGIPKETVKEATGLTDEEIQKLKKQ